MKHWREFAISEFSEIISGGTPSTRNPEFWDGDIPWVTPNDLNSLDMPYVDDTERSITRQGLDCSSAHLLPGNSIILSSRAPIGYVAIASSEMATNQGCKSLVLSDDYDPMYVYYSLVYNIDKLKSLGEGTTFAEISKSALSKVKLLLNTDKKEQVFIGKALNKIDQQIFIQKSKLAKQQRIKTGLMQDLLTKGSDEQGNIRSEDTHEFKDSPLGRIPVEWDVTSIEKGSLDVVDCPHTTPKFTNDGVLVARTFNIKNGRFQDTKASYVSESEYQTRTTRLEPQAGDIIFTREAPVGEAFVIPTGMKICLGQRVMLIRPNASEYIGEFLVTYIYSNAAKSIFDQICAGTTNPHLNVKEVRDFKFPKPPAKEQERILDAIRGINHQIGSLEIKLSKSQRVKKGLMQGLLSGQKDISQLNLDEITSNLSI